MLRPRGNLKLNLCGRGTWDRDTGAGPKNEMGYLKLKWFGMVAVVLLFAAMTTLLYFFIEDDIERPDGVIGTAREMIGSEFRDLSNASQAWLALGTKRETAGPELVLIGNETVETGLIDLSVSRYAIVGIPHCPFRNPGAIEADGAELLFAHCSGQFFRINPDGEPWIKDTGFIVPLHQAEMVAYSQQSGRQSDTSITILDLLRLRDGNTAVSYTWWNNDDKCFAFSVGLLNAAASPPVLRPVFQARPCLNPSLQSERVFPGHQAGGRLIQMTDQTLLVSIGDFEYDGVSQADLVQDPASDIGKTIEIDLVTGEHRPFSIGHRNPQGLARLHDGRIFLTEHGPQGGDEVNLIRDGLNYGWPLETLGVQYGGGNWPRDPERGGHAVYQKPVFAYMPSIGISQLMEARGFAKEWEGDLLVSSLGGHTLHRLRLNGDSVLYDEPIPLNQRLRDIVAFAGGRIALLTDDYEIIVIAVDRENKLQSVIADAPEPARNVIQGCLECHALSMSTSRSGRIPLQGMIGRKPGSWPEADYSPGLRAVEDAWTVDSLDAFLANPELMAPGTPMATKAISDPVTRRQVVETISKLSP